MAYNPKMSLKDPKRRHLCILKGMAPQVRKNMGEDPNDPGGYFIIDGKEKVIVSQEKFADNLLP